MKLRWQKITKMAVPSFLCLIAFAQSTLGETYYVAPTGSDKNAGSRVAPFRSIQHAADMVNHGDTVIVQNGTYTTTASQFVLLTKSGAPGAWITFKAEDKWGAICDGKSNSTSYGWTFAAGVSYVRIEGFDIQGFKYGGVWASVNNKATHNHIIGKKIHDLCRMA